MLPHVKIFDQKVVQQILGKIFFARVSRRKGKNTDQL